MNNWIASIIGVGLLLYGVVIPLIIRYIKLDGIRRENSGTEQGRWVYE